MLRVKTVHRQMLISDLAEQAELGLGMFIHCFIFEH